LRLENVRAGRTIERQKEPTTENRNRELPLSPCKRETDPFLPRQQWTPGQFCDLSSNGVQL
jgi:hypothetical protein